MNKLIATSLRHRLIETEDGLLLQEMGEPLIEGDPPIWAKSYYMENPEDVCFALLRGYNPPTKDAWFNVDRSYAETHPKPKAAGQIDRIEVGPYTIAFEARQGANLAFWHHRACYIAKRVEHLAFGPWQFEVTEDPEEYTQAMLHWLKSRVAP